jgi:hypothetical protein
VLVFLALVAGASSCDRPRPDLAQDDADFQVALARGQTANEAFRRSLHYVEGWLQYVDAESGLFPARLIGETERTLWSAKDCAADNFSFMVLTTALLDRSLYEGAMMDILETERTLTARLASIPDEYDFGKMGFDNPNPEYNRMKFGASEYIKDGCLPLLELLGDTPWKDRMMELLDDLWDNAGEETPFGTILTTNTELHGEQMQVLSRVYWMTGEERYLDYAVRLGDYYLLGSHHPTRSAGRLRLLDHGSEIVGGLCELYATLHFARPEKKPEYQEAIHEMLDRILEIGTNEHGLFYQVIYTTTGTHGEGLADTWGYLLNGYYTVYLIDNIERYRAAVLRVLQNLDLHYRSYSWEDYAGGTPVPELGGQDGYADAIEGALNLYQREPIPSVADWIDSEIQVLWSYQQPSGIVEGWYADGNFARTSMMVGLWKTGGVTAQPWRRDLIFGSVIEGSLLKLSIRAEREWKGRLVFDTPRHETILNLPLDWPRINQFPEWYGVRAGQSYDVNDLTTGARARRDGRDLAEGIELHLEPGIVTRLVIDAGPLTTKRATR